MDKFVACEVGEVYKFLLAHTEALLQLRKEAQAQGIAETGEYVHWLEARVIEERLGESEPELTSPVTHEEAEALTREADKRAPYA